ADLPAPSGDGYEGQHAGGAPALPSSAPACGGLTSSARPLRFGAVPPRAGCFQDRDHAHLLLDHLQQGDTVTPTDASPSGTQVHDELARDPGTHLVVNAVVLDDIGIEQITGQAEQHSVCAPVGHIQVRVVI